MTGSTVSTQTSPYEYKTNTDEIDALALDLSAELGVTEAVQSVVCELHRAYTHEDVTSTAFPATATAVGAVITQRFDATHLTRGRYDWIWRVTLNTGAVRSFDSLLNVENHQAQA